VTFDFSASAFTPNPAPLAKRGPSEFDAPSLGSNREPLARRGPQSAGAVDSSPFPPRNGIPDIPRQPPGPPPPPPPPPWPHLSFGVGGAGLATFIVFGAINQSTFNSLHDKCPSGRCAAPLTSDVDKGRRAQTIANVGFGVAVVGATVGCILLVDGANQAKAEE